MTKTSKSQTVIKYCVEVPFIFWENSSDHENNQVGRSKRDTVVVWVISMIEPFDIVDGQVKHRNARGKALWLWPTKLSVVERTAAYK